MVTYPKDWIERTLQESCIPYGLVRGPFGGSLKKEMFKPNGNKVYEQRNAIYKSISIGEYYVDDEKYKEMERFSVHENDFIISCSGTIGRIYKIPSKAPKGIINQALLKITLNTDVCDSDYFYKYFEWDKFQSKIVDDTQGGAMKNLVGMDKFRNTKIFMPQDINEQKAIATTLSTFDTHIDNLIALIEKKKAIRDGALADLMSGRTRLAGFSGKWEEFNLGKVLVINRGKRLVRSQLSISSHRKFPVYQNSLTPLGYHDSFNCLAHSTFVIAAGNAGDIGYSCKEFWAADDCYYFEHCDEINQKFLYYVLLSRQTEIYAQTRRTSIPRLSRDILEKMPILLPERSEQQAIADILTSMDTEIQNLETERDKFMQIREGAMDDLLTGRVRLPM